MSHDFTYQVGSKAIDISVKEHDLFVIIDTNLSFSKHIEIITLKANIVLGLICANFQHITPEMLKLLSTSLVQPILEYGACIWSPSLIHHKREIEGIQHHATRLIPQLPN